MIATEVNGRRIRCYRAIPRLGLAELSEWLRALISLANTIYRHRDTEGGGKANPATI